MRPGGAYFINPDKFREEYANKYIGYQVAHMTVSFLIILLVYILLVLILAPFILSAAGVLGDDGGLWDWALNYVLGMLVPKSINSLGLILPLIGTLVFQQIMNRVSTQRDPKPAA